MRIIFLFVILGISLNSFSQTSPKYSYAEQLKFKKEIKERIDISDSIDVVKVEYYENDSVFLFVDLNKNSIYNRSLELNFNPSSMYNSTYNHWMKKVDIKEINHERLEGIKGDWIPIYQHQGEFVFYYTFCNHAFQGFTVTDSTVVNYYMDGPGPEVIKEVTAINNSIMISTANGGNYKFKTIESNKDVFLLDQKGRKKYITSEANISNFPVIVELCHEMGTKLIKFDPIE